MHFKIKAIYLTKIVFYYENKGTADGNNGKSYSVFSKNPKSCQKKNKRSVIT